MNGFLGPNCPTYQLRASGDLAPSVHNALQANDPAGDMLGTSVLDAIPTGQIGQAKLIGVVWTYSVNLPDITLCYGKAGSGDVSPRH